MKTRYIINIILALIIAALYWVNVQDTNSQQQTQKISHSTPQDVTEITITRVGLDTISLQKTEANWQLTQPLQAPANNTRVKLLLSTLTSQSHAQLEQIDTATLSQLNLDPAAISLKLNNELFQFGGTESISKHRYVLNNDIVHLIDDNIMPLLGASAISFIENKLLPQNIQISKLSVPLLNNNHTFSNDITDFEKVDGHWTNNEAEQSSDQNMILIDAWKYAHATQVIPTNKAKLPSSESYKVIIWVQKQDTPIEFVMQEDKKTLYLTNNLQQLSYLFPIELLKQLLPMKP